MSAICVGEHRVKGWEKEVSAALVLVLFGYWIDRDVSLQGLYKDDLYLWSCYAEQSFRDFVFPVGGMHIRSLYYLAAWIELKLIGTHVEWIVPINILLNSISAYGLYRLAKAYSRSACVGLACALALLSSRLSYYQIGQLYGLMETMAFGMAIGILALLYVFLNGDENKKRDRSFYGACLLYLGICFVHERYVVLLPLFLFVLLCRKEKRKRLWAAPLGCFAVAWSIRLAATGRVVPAGTGGTQIADTFSVGTFLCHGASQVAYLFGINAGPEHLNGQDIRQAPMQAIRMLKCRGIYGYYEDGWIDERARIQVMAGSGGSIEMDLYHPGTINDDQHIMIDVNGERHTVVTIEEEWAYLQIRTRPYEVVTLDIRTDFYVPDAQEQRGERRLAAVLTLRAD